MSRFHNHPVPDIRKGPLYEEPMNAELEPEGALRMLLGVEIEEEPKEPE
jgi:hypothetical protein